MWVREGLYLKLGSNSAKWTAATYHGNLTLTVESTTYLKRYVPRAGDELLVTLQGSCRCGGLRVAFSTAQDLASIVPRACDCSFCQKHGAAYVSDPAGRLSISETASGSLREYRQGTNTARFFVCGGCGVLVAVVFDHASRIFGAVNVKCFDGQSCFANSVPASPQRLSVEEKTARWLALWVPDVKVTLSGA